MSKPSGPKLKTPSRREADKKKKSKKKVKPKARVELDEAIEFDYRGIKLTKQERNERMKLEYVRGMRVEEIAQRYGVSKVTVELLRSKNKWVEQKKQFDDEKALVTNDTLTQIYAGFKVSVNIKYHAAWEKLMTLRPLARNSCWITGARSAAMMKAASIRPCCNSSAALSPERGTKWSPEGISLAASSCWASWRTPEPSWPMAMRLPCRSVKRSILRSPR